MAIKLTLQAIKAAKPRAERYTLWDSELKGFGLRVNADGSKSYAKVSVREADSAGTRSASTARPGRPIPPATRR